LERIFVINYVHHVPGRLRVKAPSLKGHDARAVRVKERLEALPGIIGVKVNKTTGSVTVKYDVDQQSHHALLDALHHDGLTIPPHAASAIPSRPSKQSIGRKVGDAVISKVLETILERTAIALVAALL
jgi:copper chaperone CopZ